VCRRAVDEGVDVVIAHHPLIYNPLKRIMPQTDGVSDSVTTLVRAGVGLYAMHTNWDRAHGGINDTMARLLELQDVRYIGHEDLLALPRIGDLAAPMTLVDFVDFVGRILHCSGTSALRVNEIDPGRSVRCVAVCGGAGAGMVADAIKAGADVFVTADVRHHEFVEATARDFPIIDAGHGATERPGMRELALILPERLVGVDVVWLEAP
jgi:dinuclear metal center YbgI/SA1388 family protein